VLGTITGIYQCLRSIVYSVRNEDGERLYTQDFNANFLAIPEVKPTAQPCASHADVEHSLSTSCNPIVPFLASTRLRIGKERSGILNWLLEGLRAFYACGKNPKTPKEIAEATASYRNSDDEIRSFLLEECTEKEGAKAHVKKLYELYKGDHEKDKLNNRAFRERLLYTRGLPKFLKDNEGQYVPNLQLPEAPQFGGI
jgi:hypothetical protein